MNIWVVPLAREIAKCTHKFLYREGSKDIAKLDALFVQYIKLPPSIETPIEIPAPVYAQI